MELHNLPVTIHKRHMKLHRNVMPYMEEAMMLASKQQFNTDAKGFAVVTVDFGRVIGKHECVETTDADADDIVYAKREGRDRHMRFVRGREANDTSLLTMVVVAGAGAWKLISAWFGSAAAHEPEDPNATYEQRVAAYDFWSKHALVWGSQPVVVGTSTNVCPWPGLV